MFPFAKKACAFHSSSCLSFDTHFLSSPPSPHLPLAFHMAIIPRVGASIFLVLDHCFVFLQLHAFSFAQRLLSRSLLFPVGRSLWDCSDCYVRFFLHGLLFHLSLLVLLLFVEATFTFSRLISLISAWFLLFGFLSPFVHQSETPFCVVVFLHVVSSFFSTSPSSVLSCVTHSLVH